MQTYQYSGPVCAFGNCIVNKWSGETSAVSKKKAESNLKYQFKKQHKLIPGTVITLTGTIREV